MFAGCSASEEASGNKEGGGLQPKEEAAEKEKNIVPIKLTSYADEVGVTISQPKSQVLSVEQSFALSGEVRDAAQLKGTYVWVLLNGPEGGTFDYYIPIKEGKFEKKIKLFEGQGDYNVTVRVPDKETEDRFYDVATLQVTNESAEITRDIAMMPSGLEAGLTIAQPASGYAKVDGSLTLEGTVDEKYNGKNIMIKEEKEGDTSEMLLPIDNGKFSGDIPLYYGAGVHDITVMVPDLSREDYYLESAVISADNTSTTVMEPIEFYKNYYEQKFQLDYPKAGGLETGEKFRVAGSFDPNLESNRKVEQLIVTTKKGEDEASYLIPANNGQFDGEFWLRFGPGEYEVTLNVPTNPGAEQSYFEFAGVATFNIKSDAADRRNLMPSRGIQSDAPDIAKLAKDLTRGKKNDRAKAKAIYEYVAKTVKYDVQKLENDAFKLDDSALKTLETEKGVCQDYAFLTVAMLRSIGVEARYIGGMAHSGFSFPQRHAWVEAKVGDEWLVMDPTWGAGYVQDGKFVAKYDDKYFDPDPKEFEKTHNRNEVIY